MADPILVASLNIPQRRTFLEYAKRCAQNQTDISTFRDMLQFRDRAYSLQLDQSAKRIHEINRYLKGSERRMLDRLEVPIVMPQIESAVAYQAAIYLQKHPIFPVVGTPQYQGAALQFQSVMEQHSRRYGWVREFIKVFRDGFKYNFGPAFVNWRRVNGKTVGTATQGANVGLGQIQQQIMAGNEIKRIDPYNCFFDMLVPPANYHEDGAYFGWTELHNRMQFKRLCESLDQSKTTSFREAFESAYSALGADPTTLLGFYVPQVNPMFNPQQAKLHRGTNWLEYIGHPDAKNTDNRINYRDRYLVTHFVCRALPSDFGKQGQTSTIYYGIIVNWKHVIYVQEIISPNDYLPIMICSPNEDGLGYQTQSMLDVGLPFQDMTSALWNTTLASKRRQVFDRLLYNSAFVNKEDIDPAQEVARIPIRNAARLPGNDIAKAIYQIPYRDDNSALNLEMADRVSMMGDQAVGQNKVDRGQFQPGNKTKQEFETVMGNSNSRQQLASLVIEGNFMTPVKSTLRDNILLYQTPDELATPDNKQTVKIDPAQLRQAQLNFQLTDGKLSIEDIMKPELLMVFLQTAQTMPVLMSEYDIMGMFIYWLQLQGATWVDDFRRNQQQQQEFLGRLQATAAAQQPPQPQPGAPSDGPII